MSDSPPELYVTRDPAGSWRIEGQDTPVITNLTGTPPTPVADAIERATGHRPAGYARVLAGPRGGLRFRVRFE